MSVVVATLVVREWRVALRDGRTPWLVATLLALTLAALIAGHAEARRWNAEVAAAQAADAAIWGAQGRRNPHSAAHFGRWVFKPAAPLAHFDPGVDDYAGRGTWIEAHYQNVAALRPAEDAGPLARLGRLSGAWLLQVGLPVVLVLAGFGLFAGEREGGQLRLQLASGATAGRLLAGKALALGALALLGWAPFALALFATAADTSRAALAAGAYVLYALAWVALVLAASAACRHARGALVLLLLGWVASVLLVPRLATGVAERAAPAPDPQSFWRDVRGALEQGLDGHAPTAERRAALLERTLAAYGVATERDLPVSFLGIVLQASEEDGNRVFDHYYGRLWETYAAQDRVRAPFAALSPLLPLQAASQAAAGTDWRHHRLFVDAAERYRRELQAFLNDDITRHGRAHGHGGAYEAGPELWARAPAWRAETPSLAAAGSPWRTALLVLGLWVAVAWALAYGQVRRLVHGGLG